MDSRKDGYTQAAAAARAGLSERTGRRIDGSPVLPSQRDRTRRYRTRQDPFAEVWREELVPMLTAVPSWRATTLLEELQRRHPARYPDRMLRSLQRRVAHWRATEGPERQLIFSPGASAGPASAFGFHRRHPARRHSRWRAVSPSAVSFLACLQRLAIRQGDLRRRELHRVDRGGPGSALAARRGAAHTSHRPALGVLGVHGDGPARIAQVLTSDGAARVGRRCGPPKAIRGP
jgi:hypothetical protein